MAARTGVGAGTDYLGYTSSPASPVTFGCWFRVVNGLGATDQAIMEIGATDLTASAGWVVFGTTPGETLWHNVGSGTGVDTTVDVNDGGWWFVASVHDNANNCTHYWGPAAGALSSTTLTAGATNNLTAGVVRFGNRANSAGFRFDGLVDNGFVYNAAFTASQIDVLFRQRRPVSSANLWAWWPLLANGQDLSGNGRHLIPNGTISYSDGAPVPWGAPVYPPFKNMNYQYGLPTATIHSGGWIAV